MNQLERFKVAFSGDVTLADLMERLAKANGDAPLMEEADSGLELTFNEAADRVTRMAGGIREKIEPGDPVVVNAPNGYDFFLICMAVIRAGGVAVPVNPQMRDEEISYVKDDSGAKLVVQSADEVMGEPVDAAEATPDDVAGIFYTSGTTGKPKGAKLSHKALLGSGVMMAAYPAMLRRDEAVSGMPVAHIAGFAILLMLGCGGIPVFLLPKFKPDKALDAIEERRATMFIGVPAMYRMMLEAGAEDRDLRSVRLWASGADVMPEELIRKFKKMGAIATLPLVGASVGEAAFVDGYGMVELGGGVAVRFSLPMMNLPFTSNVVSPLPGYKLRVLDDETGEDVRIGQVGELVVKGPGVMKGYHGKDDATKETITEDGWLRTGDLARKGPLGLVQFAGRKKHVIKHGGYSVFAVEVEHSMEDHPDVVECAVIGLPDDRKGEVPVAVVRVGEGADVSEKELVDWARERMSDYKAPRQVKIVDELPRTGTDKVQKDELLKLFQEDDDGEGKGE
ncbi:MAG: Acyl-CoA synthetase (AMP-forming)/AMP-acid ligase [Acidimicrobiales bacterium]|nr:Acyl-CoA synthetase (AMP-forming)/AMP-acid ligase [Acidimicrobiales bacterium]